MKKIFQILAILIILLSGCVSKKRYNALMKSSGDSVSYIEKIRYKNFKIPSDSSWFYGQVKCPSEELPILVSKVEKQGQISKASVAMDNKGNVSLRCDCEEQNKELALVDRYYKEVKSANADIILENTRLEKEVNKLRGRAGIINILKQSLGILFAIAVLLLALLYLLRKLRLVRRPMS